MTYVIRYRWPLVGIRTMTVQADTLREATAQARITARYWPVGYLWLSVAPALEEATP